MSKLTLAEPTAWLFQQQLLRRATPAGQRFELRDLRGEFDAVVFLQESTPAQILP